jgi:hypothetical protein
MTAPSPDRSRNGFPESIASRSAVAVTSKHISWPLMMSISTKQSLPLMSGTNAGSFVLREFFRVAWRDPLAPFLPHLLAKTLGVRRSCFAAHRRHKHVKRQLFMRLGHFFDHPCRVGNPWSPLLWTFVLIETRTLPTLARRYPRGFTFCVALLVSSVRVHVSRKLSAFLVKSLSEFLTGLASFAADG